MSEGPLSDSQCAAIRIFWDAGCDTAEIADFLAIPEYHVSPVISEYVTAKKFRKSAF